MDIFMFFLFSAIGYLVSAFGIMQILLVLFVAFPLVKIFTNNKMLVCPDVVIKKSVITLLLWTVIVGTVSFFIFAYASTASIVGYITGILFVLLLGIKRLRLNGANTEDFINTHKDCFDWCALMKSLHEYEKSELDEDNLE